MGLVPQNLEIVATIFFKIEPSRDVQTILDLLGIKGSALNWVSDPFIEESVTIQKN